MGFGGCGFGLFGFGVGPPFPLRNCNIGTRGRRNGFWRLALGLEGLDLLGNVGFDDGAGVFDDSVCVCAGGFGQGVRGGGCRQRVSSDLAGRP